MAKINSEGRMEGVETLEIKWPGDGRIFINFWDYANANDVVCQLVDDKLMLKQHDEEGNDLPAKEISFIEFLSLTTKSILDRKT